MTITMHELKFIADANVGNYTIHISRTGPKGHWGLDLTLANKTYPLQSFRGRPKTFARLDDALTFASENFQNFKVMFLHFEPLTWRVDGPAVKPSTGKDKIR